MILQVLIDRGGEVVENAQLVRLVWPDTVVEDANIRVHVSALRRALGDGQNGARYIVNIPGRGYSFTAPVTRVTEAPTADRAPELRVQANSILPNTRLVGRADALTKLASELTREQMVTVVGPGGIGKTSLALATAQSWSNESGYEMFFVDLATVTNPDVPRAVAAALSISTIYEDVVGAMIRDLHDRRALIVLDNCEHVISAAAALCEALLAGTKSVRFLATSRDPLRIASEWTHRAAPLTFPPPGQDLTASEALRFSAVQLFVERATASLDTFEFRDENAPAVADICRRLDGIPLALEFAAARVGLFDVGTIARRLDDRFTLLTRGRRNAMPRHQTLRAALDWSYDFLSEREQIALRRLGVFSTYFDVGDAAEVIVDEDLPKATVLEILSELVDKSMVVADVGGQTVAYRLLETTQVYADEKLREAGELEGVRRRHAQRFLTLCRESAGFDDAQGLLRRAMVEVRAALDWALVRGSDVGLGVDLASVATPVCLRLSLLREHRRYLELALLHMPAVADKHSKTEMLLRTALALSLYFTDGPGLTVDDHLQKTRRIARQLGDASHELKVLWMLFGIAANTGAYRPALGYAKTFGKVAKATADPMAGYSCHRLLGRALTDVGQHANARRHIELALQPMREAMPPLKLHAYEIDHWVASRATRSRILWLQGFPDDAKVEAERCLREALRLGHTQSTCWALTYNVVPVAIWRGDLAEARHCVDVLLEQSKGVFEHWHEWGVLYDQFLNQSASEANPRSKDTFADLKQSVPAQADLLATFDVRLVGPETLARAQSDENIWCGPEILRAWAERLMLEANETAADGSAAALARSLDIARRHGAKAWELRAATSLAILRRASGRLSEAGTALEPALHHFTQGQQTRDVLAAVHLLSQLHGHEQPRSSASVSNGTDYS